MLFRSNDIIDHMSTHEPLLDLLSAASSVSRYLMAHMVNVSIYSMRVGVEMSLKQEDVLDVGIGGLLADIGMLLVPAGLWTSRKDLQLTARDQVQRHCELGYQLLKETPGIKEEWRIPALQHHERLNGSGYPFGIAEDKIALSSRIVMITDVYDALTSERTYRHANFPDVAMKQILGSPDVYDRRVAQTFCKSMGFYPEGYSVKLSTGERALVIRSNPRNAFRPLVRIMTDTRGEEIPPDGRLELDLTGRLDLSIVEISNRRYAQMM